MTGTWRSVTWKLNTSGSPASMIPLPLRSAYRWTVAVPPGATLLMARVILPWKSLVTAEGSTTKLTAALASAREKMIVPTRIDGSLQAIFFGNDFMAVFVTTKAVCAGQRYTREMLQAEWGPW